VLVRRNGECDLEPDGESRRHVRRSADRVAAAFGAQAAV
jgi:hypothetical protein